MSSNVNSLSILLAISDDPVVLQRERPADVAL